MRVRNSGHSHLFFTSPRERRLWGWTTLILVAIFATLGFAPVWVGKFLDRGLFDAAFILAFFLFWGVIFTQGLKVRPRGAEVGVALGVVVVYLMVFARLGIPERSHLFEYGVVAVFIYEALAERRKHGRRVPAPAALAVLATFLFGAVDEGLQVLLPGRVFAWSDLLFNGLAALMATVACVALGWARQKAETLRSS